MSRATNSALHGVGPPPDDLNSPDGFSWLSADEQDCLLAWIALAIQPATTVGRLSSYGLKHAFEALGGFYVTNGEFKGAMREAGYAAEDERAVNWTYHVKPTRGDDGRWYRRWGESY